LYVRYSHHPNAAQQGIYLVLWFGENEKIANHKIHEVNTPAELKEKIEKDLPVELEGRIDIFVLDLAKIN